MKKAYFSKAAYTLSVMVILALAAAPWSGQSVSPKVAVSIVSDDAPGLAARNGLNKLAAALKARGVAIEQVNSLEAARGETLIVAGRATASGAAAALHKSLGVELPEGAAERSLDHLPRRQTGRGARTALPHHGLRGRGGLRQIAGRRPLGGLLQARRA